ncbi:MAG TPA: adenylate/guanylate cyclase domain-containing protein [Burkholderiales bacterium]|nr:adenylate/guanylate cyclase domain-containing protein [Burkholderiales bacterium]
MDGEVTRTVLFADVSGSTQLYENAGDEAAAQAIAQCIRAFSDATRLAGGQVVKEIGDEVMSIFPTPDAAAIAATRMHIAVQALPPVAGIPLGARIGFQTGPVVRRDNELFGDTVGLAEALASQAAKGQVLTSEETAALLSPALRSCTRVLYSVELRGKAERVSLCELVWRQGPDITDVAGNAIADSAGRLSLKHGEAEVRQEPPLRIGRDKDCEIVVSSENASRRHCTIERRREKFVLRDHSTNGTYVTVDGQPEFMLHREEHVLRGHGWISFGEPRARGTESLEYYCE